MSSFALEPTVAPVYILYGTTSGNSELLADETAGKLKEMGLPVHIISMADFNKDELDNIKTLLLMVSTDGDGEPPYMAEDLYKFLNEKTEAGLDHLAYSVLALGDSFYPDFCQAGKDFDLMLEKLGARKLAERVDCDEHYWQDFEKWLNQVLPALREKTKTQLVNEMK